MLPWLPFPVTATAPFFPEGPRSAYSKSSYTLSESSSSCKAFSASTAETAPAVETSSQRMRHRAVEEDCGNDPDEEAEVFARRSNTYNFRVDRSRYELNTHLRGHYYLTAMSLTSVCTLGLFEDFLAVFGGARAQFNKRFTHRGQSCLCQQCGLQS